MESFINPFIRHYSKRLSASRESYLNLLKFVSGAAFACLLAWILALILAAIGMDPRNSFFGVYDQRNALVVGFMMGFAIIPIIYTLTEDALSSVPDHLRSASLGCGATVWQTTIKIVIPTAMSGIFSAVMVGLGRAVGETMIVLMAAGNVPVLDMNMFNGFRTLSANIAVELPEAVQGSAHYRALFLAALTLFIFTFLLNTFAESLRQRVRKRAYEL
jgi:phosphate transport system permease protein